MSGWNQHATDETQNRITTLVPGTVVTVWKVVVTQDWNEKQPTLKTYASTWKKGPQILIRQDGRHRERATPPQLVAHQGWCLTEADALARALWTSQTNIERLQQEIAELEAGIVLIKQAIEAKS